VTLAVNGAQDSRTPSIAKLRNWRTTTRGPVLSATANPPWDATMID